MGPYVTLNGKRHYFRGRAKAAAYARMAKKRGSRYSVPVKSSRPNYKRKAFRKAYRKTPYRRLGTKLNVKDKHFFLAPQQREVALTLVNDNALILKKPWYGDKVVTQYYGSQEGTGDFEITSTMGPSETHFRFSPSIDAVRKQLDAYLTLYKEICICGVTITFTPTWTRSSLTNGLKITQVHKEHKTTNSGEAAAAQNPTHPGSNTSEHPVDITSQGRIPYGLYPRLYYKHLDYGTSQDPSSIMSNSNIAIAMNAKSHSLASGKKQTIRFVPKMFKTFRTSDGSEVSRPVTAKWFPTDDIGKRTLGGMDFLITPFPNFDYNITSEVKTQTLASGGNFMTTMDGQTLASNDDDTEFNEQYVIVNRVYHIKVRGRKDVRKKSFHDSHIAPTNLDQTIQWIGPDLLPPKSDTTGNGEILNDLGLPMTRLTGYGDIQTQIIPALKQSVYLGAKQDAVNQQMGNAEAVQSGEAPAKRRRVDETATEGLVYGTIGGAVQQSNGFTGAGMAQLAPTVPTADDPNNDDFDEMSE